MSDLVGIDTLNIGFDPMTGENLYGWSAVAQDISEGMLTDFGVRIAREYFGSLVPRALGQNITTDLMLTLLSDNLIL